MRTKHVSIYDKNATAISSEMRSLFNETEAIKGRPPTPDLTDNSVPCINSVQHLIKHCIEYETEIEAQSENVMDLLVENPTNDLELVSRSLEKIKDQSGVPEYDIRLGKDFVVDKKKELDDVIMEVGDRFGPGRKPLYFTEKGPRSKIILGEGRMASTSKTNMRIKGVDDDDATLGEVSLSNYSLADGSISNSSTVSSVKWKNGHSYHSLLSAAAPGHHHYNSSSAPSSRKKRRGLIDSFASDSLDDNYSIGESTLASSSYYNSSSTYCDTSLAPTLTDSISSKSYLKQKSMKPRNFSKTRRRKGPFQLVGPDDVRTDYGLPPVQNKDKRTRMLMKLRDRRRSREVNTSKTNYAAKKQDKKVTHSGVEEETAQTPKQKRKQKEQGNDNGNNNDEIDNPRGYPEKLVGMQKLKHLVPELHDAPDQDVDVKSLLPRIFKSVKKNGQSEIRAHKRENYKRNIGRGEVTEDEIWLKDALLELQMNHKEVGRRERVRTKTLRKVAKSQRKLNHASTRKLLLGDSLGDTVTVNV